MFFNMATVMYNCSIAKRKHVYVKRRSTVSQSVVAMFSGVRRSKYGKMLQTSGGVDVVSTSVTVACAGPPPLVCV